MFWTDQPKYSKSDDFLLVCAIIDHNLLCCKKLPKTNLWLTLDLIYNYSFLKNIIRSIFCISYQFFSNFWRQKNPESTMVHGKKIWTTGVWVNKRVFNTQSGVGFWYQPLFWKIIVALPGCGTFRAKIFIWANSVIIHRL